VPGYLPTLRLNFGSGVEFYARSLKGRWLQKPTLFLSNVSLQPTSTKTTVGFIAASFALVLYNRQTEAFLDYSAPLHIKLKHQGLQNKLHPVYSTRFLWYAWSNFIHTLHALAVGKHPTFVLASSPLRLLAQTLGWYTYGGSYLAWKVMSGFLKKPKLRDVSSMWSCRGEGAVIFLLRPVTSYTAFTFFRKLALPLVGLSGTLSSEQLLWQNANIFSMDLNLQYLVLALYWSLLSRQRA